MVSTWVIFDIQAKPKCEKIWNQNYWLLKIRENWVFSITSISQFPNHGGLSSYDPWAEPIYKSNINFRLFM